MRRQHADPDHLIRRSPRRLTGGVDPARHYIDGILPDVLEGRTEPGRVFDRTVGLDGVPDGYRAMADRQSLKVLIAP
jgi:threonine dehydrogenase-like Zn-dependent dehydrogenase